MTSPNKGRWSLEEKILLYSKIWGVSKIKTKHFLLLFNRFMREHQNKMTIAIYKLCQDFLLCKEYKLQMETRTTIQIRTHLQKVKEKIKYRLKGCQLKQRKQKKKTRKKSLLQKIENLKIKNAARSLLNLSKMSIQYKLN